MKKYYIYILAFIGALMISCHKDFLDVKPNIKLVVPQSVSDLQALLDNTKIMNELMPALTIASADNLYLELIPWQTVDVSTKNAYTWEKEVYEGWEVYDWNKTYEKVFYANIVLDEIDKMKSTETEAINNVKGSALFYRAFSFFQLSQLFALPYREESANETLGIPLRLESSIERTVKRATMKETYEQMIADLKEAVPLLPEKPVIQTRPSKASCHALLANIFMQMHRYDDALINAEKSLSYQSGLMDFNTLDSTASYPFPKFNEEVVFNSTMTYGGVFAQARFNVVFNLYNSYEKYDLRPALYFFERTGNFVFKGSFDGSRDVFNGLATNEMYLVAAESHARLGNNKQALELMNTLLEKRYVTGTYSPIKLDDNFTILKRILSERRKELVFRGIRWSDLRRLNQDERFAIDLERNIDGENYTLKANDPRYALPIPIEVVRMSNVEQNKR